MYKDSSSKYFLNGKQKEYSAVRDLLLSHGIDLDNNRFLILQGEVEQIAMMKPKGMRRHFEVAYIVSCNYEFFIYCLRSDAS